MKHRRSLRRQRAAAHRGSGALAPAAFAAGSGGGGARRGELAVERQALRAHGGDGPGHGALVGRRHGFNRWMDKLINPFILT